MSSVGTAQYTAVLIGCGRMGAQDSSRLKGVLPTGWLPLSHAECMRSHPQIRLVGVCDPDADRLNQAGNAYDVQARFIDYREMLTSLKPNLVSVATRTGERPEIIELALSQGVRGLHVEKPLARSLGETRRVLGLLQEYNAFLTYGTTRRFMPIYRKAKVLLEQGRIGELQEVVIEHGHTNLLWSHPHSVDLLLYFVGTTQVRDVQASCTFQDNQSSLSLVEEDPLVDNALVRFADGVRGLITGASGMNTRLCGT